MSLIEEIAKFINIDDLPAEIVKRIVSLESGAPAKDGKMAEDDGPDDMDEDD